MHLRCKPAAQNVSSRRIDHCFTHGTKTNNNHEDAIILLEVRVMRNGRLNNKQVVI